MEIKTKHVVIGALLLIGGGYLYYRYKKSQETPGGDTGGSSGGGGGGGPIALPSQPLIPILPVSVPIVNVTPATIHKGIKPGTRGVPTTTTIVGPAPHSSAVLSPQGQTPILSPTIGADGFYN